MRRVRSRQASFGGLGQPWSMTLSRGASLAGIYNLYPTKGTGALAASDLMNAQDGPMHVVRAGTLTITSALTLNTRGRGLVLLLDGLSMGGAGSLSVTGKGAAGSSKWVNQDITIPPAMSFAGRNTAREEFFAYLAAKGYWVCDPNLFASPPADMGDVQADYAAWPMATIGTSTTSVAMVPSGALSITTQAGLGLVAGNRVTVYNSADPTKWMSGTVASYNSGTGALVVTVSSYSGSGTFATWAVVPTSIIAASGCGAAVSGTAYPAISGAVGSPGNAGSNGAPGGGGTGGVNAAGAGGAATTQSAPGNVWGGGPGSSGTYGSGANYVSREPDAWGGIGGVANCNGAAGGGAGNPGGAAAGGASAGNTGTGGTLIIIVRGNVSLTAGHVISANGADGGAAASGCGGGGSGGGSITLIYSGALNGNANGTDPTGLVNLVANGGAGGTGTRAGGAGGAGSVRVRTFTEMGW